MTTRASFQRTGYADLALMERSLPEIARLIDHEVGLRETGRQLELDPNRRGAAADFFRTADRVRAERMRRLERCGLI